MATGSEIERKEGTGNQILKRKQGINIYSHSEDEGGKLTGRYVDPFTPIGEKINSINFGI